MDFTVDCLLAAEHLACTIWAEFPEDLGTAEKGDPASLWQRPELRNTGMVRGALFQCEWCDAPYAKPTGIITNCSKFYEDSRFYQGWPEFSSPNAGDRHYRGPLPPTCRHGGHKPLRGWSGGQYTTAPTAAYPPGFCEAIARAILASEIMVDMPVGPTPSTLETGVGVGSGVAPHETQTPEGEETPCRSEAQGARAGVWAPLCRP